MVARVVVCRIEACSECEYYRCGFSVCENPDYPRLNRYIRDPESIPMICPLQEAPDES